MVLGKADLSSGEKQIIFPPWLLCIYFFLFKTMHLKQDYVEWVEDTFSIDIMSIYLLAKKNVIRFSSYYKWMALKLNNNNLEVKLYQRVIYSVFTGLISAMIKHCCMNILRFILFIFYILKHLFIFNIICFISRILLLLNFWIFIFCLMCFSFFIIDAFFWRLSPWFVWSPLTQSINHHIGLVWMSGDPIRYTHML